MRNISVKIDDAGYVLPAGDFNTNLRQEIQAACESAGFTLDPEGGPDTNTQMLGQTLAIYSNAGFYYVDAGGINTYILTRSGQLKSLPEYKDGMTVLFKTANANTGASTINVDGLGVKAFTSPTGAAMQAGDVLAGYVFARYNATDDRFELVASVAKVIKYYNATETYKQFDLVMDELGSLWISLTDDNLNNDPRSGFGVNWLPAVFAPVAGHTGGGNLAAHRMNELRDGGDYYLPSAASAGEDGTITIMLPDRYSDFMPKVYPKSGSSDSIMDKDETPQDYIHFDTKKSEAIILTSNGIDEWSF